VPFRWFLCALFVLLPFEAASAPPERPFEVGYGFNLGLAPGLKFRGLGLLDSGLILGVDLEADFAGIVADASVRALLGYRFDLGDQTVRPYLAVGGGAVGVYSHGVGPAWVLAAGAEWRPLRWLGVGLEGGVFRAALSDGAEWVPAGRLVALFY
jgi:hypothetical protein